MGRVPEKCFFLSSSIDCFLLTPISQATWECDHLERLNTQISRICRLSCTVKKSLVSDLQLRTSRPERCYIFLPTFPSWRWGRQSEVASPRHATSSPCHASHHQRSGVSESKKGKIQTSAFFGGGRRVHASSNKSIQRTTIAWNWKAQKFLLCQQYSVLINKEEGKKVLTTREPVCAVDYFVLWTSMLTVWSV